MTPLSESERAMYSEIMTEIRHVRDSIDRVHSSLDQHVRDEDHSFAELREDNARLREQVTDLREDVATLKTRWGILASFAAVAGAAFMAAIQKIFF